MNSTRIINPHAFVVDDGGGGGGGTLLTGLSNWWDLNEASGNAIDSTGNQDLTDSNTVGSTSSGVPDGGSARSFNSANSESFSAASGTIMNSGSAITIAFWSNVTADAGTKAVFGHHAPNGFSMFHFNSLEWPHLQFDGSTAMREFVASSGWDSWVCTSTGPGGSDEVFKNGSSIATGSYGWEPGSAVFYMGVNYIGSTWYYNGDLASFGIWDRVLTSAEITEFHNSGTNLRYADL